MIFPSHAHEGLMNIYAEMIWRQMFRYPSETCREQAYPNYGSAGELK